MYLLVSSKKLNYKKCTKGVCPPVRLHHLGRLVSPLRVELGRAGLARHNHVVGGVLRQPVLSVKNVISNKPLFFISYLKSKKGQKKFEKIAEYTVLYDYSTLKVPVQSHQLPDFILGTLKFKQYRYFPMVLMV
jgi:hypothetical protein